MKKITVLLLLFIFTSTLYSKVGEDKNKFKDPRDNEVYRTVKIGDNIWMAENLRYLPEITPKNEWGSHDYPQYSVYDYYGTDLSEAKETEYYKNYGVLYNYLSAVEACPPGWRLPDREDLNKLLEDVKDINSDSYEALVIGSKNGLNPLLGGWRSSFGRFFGKGFYGNWWSSSSHSIYYAWGLYLYGYERDAFLYYIGIGTSVRCMKE